MGQNAIDLEHLARYTGGEKGLNSEVLQLFDGQISAMVAELHTVLASRDGKRWREVAHTIKGAARGVGAFAMGDLAALAEPISPGDASAAKDMIAKLEREAQTVHAFIDAYLAA
jgi:HPt (histidine-containing phosphotransfer) domain-containing protein